MLSYCCCLVVQGVFAEYSRFMATEYDVMPEMMPSGETEMAVTGINSLTSCVSRLLFQER